MKRTLLILLLFGAAPQPAVTDEPRLRLIIETDAGGDPDDEQSLVRFLLCANEWDVEGIIANRPHARDGENLNAQRTGLGIVRQMIRAYGECWPRLKVHDDRYPTAEALLERTVPGDIGTDDGVQLILTAVDAADARPVWFLNWGTDEGAAVSCLRRALDRVLAERGPDGYAKFKRRLRLSSDDQFGEHTKKIEPPFPLWVDTFRPEQDSLRWYHRFSAITAKAGGFDVERDVRTGHGPLGALYPTNTTHPQKEGDSLTFLYLMPVGLGEPDQPTWGSWAGRYGPNENFAGKPYFHANQRDAWQGKTNRDNTLARWAEDLQNDFRARLEWCVKSRREANHPPRAQVVGPLLRQAAAGERVTLDASGSSDPDGDRLSFEWRLYPEPSDYDGPLELVDGDSAKASFVTPEAARGKTLHLLVTVRDSGSPPLARYGRVRVAVQ